MGEDFGGQQRRVGRWWQAVDNRGGKRIGRRPTSDVTRPCRMADMRIYLLSLGAGLLVGIVYSLLNVRSPAPPVVALVGLLGILVGEQIIPVAKRMVEGSHLATAWRQAQCTPHIFGLLPGSHAQAMQAKSIRPLNPEKTYEQEK